MKTAAMASMSTANSVIAVQMDAANFEDNDSSDSEIELESDEDAISEDSGVGRNSDTSESDGNPGNEDQAGNFALPPHIREVWLSRPNSGERYCDYAAIDTGSNGCVLEAGFAEDPLGMDLETRGGHLPSVDLEIADSQDGLNAFTTSAITQRGALTSLTFRDEYGHTRSPVLLMGAKTLCASRPGPTGTTPLDRKDDDDPPTTQPLLFMCQNEGQEDIAPPQGELDPNFTPVTNKQLPEKLQKLKTNVQEAVSEVWTQIRSELSTKLNAKSGLDSRRETLRPGGLVIVAGSEWSDEGWPMGIVQKVYPGEDGKPRSADVLVQRVQPHHTGRPRVATVRRPRKDVKGGLCSLARVSLSSPPSQERFLLFDE